MSDEDLYAGVRQAILDAAARAGVVHIKHALILEGLDPTDGERAVWLIPSEGTTTWDTLGLLAFATAQEQAGATGGDTA